MTHCLLSKFISSVWGVSPDTYIYTTKVSTQYHLTIIWVYCLFDRLLLSHLRADSDQTWWEGGEGVGKQSKGIGFHGNQIVSMVTRKFSHPSQVRLMVMIFGMRFAFQTTDLLTYFYGQFFSLYHPQDTWDEKVRYLGYHKLSRKDGLWTVNPSRN